MFALKHVLVASEYANACSLWSTCWLPASTRTHVRFEARAGCQPIRERMFAKGPQVGHSGPQGPLWPACGPLWPAVARLWPLMAPYGPLWPLVAPLFSTGEPLKNFRVARCAGHRATGPPEIFQRFGVFVFFHFSADGRRYRKRRESIILSFLLLVDRRPKNEKKRKLRTFEKFRVARWPGGPHSGPRENFSKVRP